MQGRPLLILCTALLAAAPALAQSDRETFERSLDATSRHCPGHSRDRSTPGLRAIPIGGLRVLLAQGIVVCPDRRLDADAPVVWYGGAGAYAWNPEVEGAVDVLAAQVGAMTRQEDFPKETLVWSADGEALRDQVVPAFESRRDAPDSSYRRW